MRPSRALRCVALCLGLGALTSVLVAWSLRAWYQKTPVSRQPYTLSEGDRSWEATLAVAPGRYTVMYQGLPPPGSGWQIARTQGDPDPIPFTSEPAWAAAMRRTHPGLIGIGAYGWPWFSLHSFTVLSASGADYRGLFTTPGWFGPAGGIRLPLLPFWRGMLADSACFAAAWWLALAATATLRRRLRLSRGLCPACGYNLVGNTNGLCPECGTPITTPTAQAATLPTLSRAPR